MAAALPELESQGMIISLSHVLPCGRVSNLSGRDVMGCAVKQRRRHTWTRMFHPIFVSFIFACYNRAQPI